MNFSEIATEDNKDEDKASLPDTEVGEVEDFSQQQLADFEAENEDKDEDDTEPESKKPKYSAPNLALSTNPRKRLRSLLKTTYHISIRPLNGKNQKSKLEIQLMNGGFF